MRYLQLAPFFVYLTLSNVATVSSRPLDQATALGDMTLGLVGPTAIPNLKLPGVGGAALPTGAPSVPGAAGASAPKVPGTPNVPGAPQVPGAPKVPGAPQVPGAPKVPSAPKVPGAPSLSHLPIFGGIPIRRSPSSEPGHGNARLQPRVIRGANYGSASPNATIPEAPAAADTTAAAASRKRATKEFRQGFTVLPSDDSMVNHSKRATRHSDRKPSHPSSSKARKQPNKQPAKQPAKQPTKQPSSDSPKQPAAQDNVKAKHQNKPSSSSPDSSASGGPAGGLANLVKSVGILPKTLSPVVDAVPSVPDTPLTSADTNPTIDAADNTVSQSEPKAKVPVNEKAPVPGSNAGAYPVAPGYNVAPSVSASTTKTKRHSFVLDTDPLLPPSDEAAEKKDKAMGLINMDSNEKPAVPSKLPSAVPKITPAPTSTVPAPTKTMSIYQPSEPGYGAGYPAPTA
ncbi:hypothetical protein BDW22DRAFT_1486550 [Trametopsis cervina]|nr:hypothetical protein BDW22DRAFT_1486550 [Trametopsis cervina]